MLIENKYVAVAAVLGFLLAEQCYTAQ